MKIRKAIKSDLPKIQELNKDLFKFEEQFGHSYNIAWTFEKEGVKYFKSRLGNLKALNFIAEENGQPVGYIISFIAVYPYRSINPICEIENMFVQDKYRNQGIGTELIATVREEAIKKGVKRLRVGAIAQNKNAIDFYKEQGFEDVNLYLEKKL